MNEWSAVMSLQREIESALSYYYYQNGRYPETLHDLTLNYAKTDQAGPRHLDEFLYATADQGHAYTLVSKGDLRKGLPRSTAKLGHESTRTP